MNNTNKDKNDNYLHHDKLKHKHEKEGELHDESVKDKKIEGPHHVKADYDNVTTGIESHEMFGGPKM
jgi:hypothetical protein